MVEKSGCFHFCSFTWSNPELGWCSWTTGKTEVTLRMTHKIKLKLMKNSCSLHWPVLQKLRFRKV